VTFHGPGQLVVSDHRTEPPQARSALVSPYAGAVADRGAGAARYTRRTERGYTGVWTRGRKIASIGIHVKQWVTWHGFALNVTTDLTEFERIVPCGIAGVEMTSVQRELGAGAGHCGMRRWPRLLTASKRHLASRQLSVTKFLDALRSRSPVADGRLPPGQVLTTKWPVLHYGDVPQLDTRTWTFDVSGLVDRPFILTYEELLALPRKTVQCDIHCVTRWSRLDNTFEVCGAPAAGTRGGEARRAVLPGQRRAGVHHKTYRSRIWIARTT